MLSISNKRMWPVWYAELLNIDTKRAARSTLGSRKPRSIQFSEVKMHFDLGELARSKNQKQCITSVAAAACSGWHWQSQSLLSKNESASESSRSEESNALQKKWSSKKWSPLPSQPIDPQSSASYITNHVLSLWPGGKIPSDSQRRLALSA